MGNCCNKRKKEELQPLVKEESNIKDIIKVDLDSFEYLKVLGKGTFGKVVLVREKKTRKLYAMKILKKKFIRMNKQIEHTKTERDLLVDTHYDFIVNLYYAFQNDENLYLVTEFMQGGELFFHLHREKKFDNKRVQFYIAEIILALEHLHKNNIIYRE